MADKTFNVTISAKDSASGALATINKRIASMNATVAKARAPFDQLRRNYDRFLKLSGAGAIAGGLGRVARSGFSAFQSITRIVEPLAAITGAASIAGMMRLAVSWSNFGSQLGNAAFRAGLTATQLQGLQNAARLAGVSSEALTGGMTALRDNMVNAVGGKAPQVVSMLQALGLSANDAKRYAEDTTKALPELADKIAGLKNPTLEAEAATALFGGAGEQLLPFLRKGSAGIAEYNALAAQYGLTSTDGADAANKLREAQTRLTLSVEGLGNSVGEALAPVLGPLLTQMADWIAHNREWIATGIGQKVKEFADYIRRVNWTEVGSNIVSVLHAVNDVVQALGGWVRVGEVVLGFFAVTWLAKMLSPLIAISTMLLKLPKQAAAATAEANVELGKIKPGGTGGMGGGLMKGLASMAGMGLLEGVLSGDMGRAAAANLDERDRQAAAPPSAAPPDTRAWYERFYKPGPGLIDSLPGSQGPNASMAGRGAHPAEMGRRDPTLPSGRNAQGGVRSAAGDAQWSTDLAQLQGYGWTREQAAGILGNTDQESNGNEKAVGDGGKAYGLQQWHADRQANFAKFAGHDIHDSTHAEQIAFVNWELNTTERGAGNHLRQASTVRDSAAAVRRYYERPANTSGLEDTWRGDRAERILAAAGRNGPPAPSGAAVNLPANAGTAANPGGGGVTPNGQVQVGVKIDNASPGITTTATQSGSGMLPLKVERSMVGYGHAA